MKAFKIRGLKFAGCLALVLWAPGPNPLQAAITQTINYQGFLLSKITNLPVETPQDVKFTVYDAAVGGTSRFSEIRCNMPVAKGRYDVEIGSTSGGITPASIFTDYGGLWLQISVDANGDCVEPFEAMTPRVRLQASPYAFNALYASTASAATPVFSADVIGALPVTQFGAVTISSNLFVQGGISVGSISPGLKLAVAGVVESSGPWPACSSDPLNPSCGFKFPDGSIQYRASAATKWEINGENLYTSNLGNVGIGESLSVPLARLHVSTGAGETGNILIVSTGPSVMFRVNGLGQVHGSSFHGNGATLVGIVAKGGDTMTGQLTLAGSSLTVTSLLGINTPKVKFRDSVEISSTASTALFPAGVLVSTNIYVVGVASAARFFGDGSGLTAVTTTDNSKVLKAGDTMTGQLTLANSTLTVTGAAFSVAGSTFSVFGGSVAVGGAAYLARLSVSGGIIATSSVTAQGGLYSPSATLSQGLTASSGTFTASGAAQYSLETTSGIKVNSGVVTAPFFVGNGSQLSSVAGTDASRVLRAGDAMTGNLTVNGASVTIINASAIDPYSFTVSSAQNVNAYGLAVTTTGRVGVQVLMPTAPLEVYKQIVVSNLEGSDASLYLRANGGNMTYLRWTEDSRGDQGALGFPLASRDLVYRAGGTDSSTGGQEVFRISAGAAGAAWKFGIGTNAPSEKLHIAANMLVSTSATSPILYISTSSGLVSISTNVQTHALTVNGGLVARSSITAQGGFYGDASGLVNISSGSLPLAIQFSTITSPSGSAYDAVVFATSVYITSRLAVGQLFDPVYDLQVRGVTALDQKNSGDSVVLAFDPHVGGNSYISWKEAGVTHKGALGMIAGSRDLVYSANTSVLGGGVEAFRIKPDGKFGIGTGLNPAAGFHVATDLLVSSSPTNPVLFVSTAQGAIGIWTNTPQERFNVGATALFGSKASPLIYASTATGYTGIGTASPRAKLEIVGNLIASGTYTGSTTGPVTGPGTSMLWVPSAAALRAGYASGAEWDTLGLYSVAFGNRNSATAAESVVSGGFNNVVSGRYSAIAGGYNQVVTGDRSVVGGGDNNVVYGQDSVIPGGQNNIVLSSWAFAGGMNNFLGTAARGTFVWGYDDFHSPGIAFHTFPITDQYVFLVDPANIKQYKVGIRTPSPQAALDVNGDAQFGAGVTKSSFTAEGFWMPRWEPISTIDGLTPTAAGQVIGNSSTMNLCVSSGTTRGAWAVLGTSGATHCN